MSSCSGKAIEKYEWLTLDDEGNILSTKDVTYDDFRSEAGRAHILRVHLENLQECPFYSASFGIDFF